MKMLKKLFFVVTYFICPFLNSVAADSCLTLNTTSIGNKIGTNYTDYDYVKTNEDPSFYYRLAVMQLCTNSASTLTGMRAVISMIVAETNSTGTQIPLNRFGSVTEAGITCANLTLDY